MGQLLKMQDFVSRYETDLIRYTNQFIRLKKQQWEKFRENWENGPEEEEEAPAQEESSQVLSRMKHWLKRKDTAEIEEPDAPVYDGPPGELDFA
ncbi:MAG: NERD domain-containing protein, partial [Bacillus sp. (in: Bacteria)]|nr:NERD domain-containing protein [Bacillus sp. (in: firmicutes)]